MSSSRRIEVPAGGHLDDAALEALSHGRDDLVSGEQRAHLDACGDCAELVLGARELSRALGAALRAATPDLNVVDELVRTVVAQAPLRPPAPRASRRSLTAGVLLAAPAALVLGLFSFVGGVTPSSVTHSLRDAWTVVFTVSRVAAVHVTPAALATAAMTGVCLVALLSVAMRALLRGPRALGPVEVVR
jgi:hypothetical protein